MSFLKKGYMDEALKEAELAYQRKEVPVGAVIVDYSTNQIIARAGNLVENLQDPTAHAEILAIREASRILNSKILNNCGLYVTLEPCPMCAHAISLARIKRLYFAAYDMKGGGVQHGARVFFADSCHYMPEIYEGIKAEQSIRLLQNFFKALR